MFEIICDKSKFDFALNTVGKAINPNSTLPILTNLLINAKEGKLNFLATNLEMGISFSLDAEILKEGEITVPAKQLISYVSLISDEKIHLLVDDKNSLNIITGKSKTKIKCLDAVDFPSIPKVDRSLDFKLPVKAFRESIDLTIFSSSQNISRPSLLGAYLSVSDGELSMVCTNSYRLAERNINLFNNNDSFNCLVPSKTLVDLSKILLKFEEDTFISIFIDKNQILFKIDEFEMVSRLIEGNFPDYKRIIPSSFKTSVIVDREKLLLAVKKISIFAKENNNSLKLMVDDGKLILESEETVSGEEYNEIEADVEGENNEVVLNYQYILDFLLNNNVERVHIFISDKLLPVTFKEKTEESSYTYLIMPLKV